MRALPLQRRSAFTLVEMLIALAIVLMIASLIVAFGPGFQKTEKAARGADLLQRWLLVAKQRARRSASNSNGPNSGFACGVHLVVDPATGFVNTLEYVEQPDNYRQGQVIATSPTPTIPMTARLNVDVSAGVASSSLLPVQPGDYLDLLTPTEPQRLIIGVAPGMPLPGQTTLTLLANTTSYITPVTTTPVPYSIVRAPRPTQGEEPLKLPQDIIIDLTASLPGVTVPDIMFLPSGGVRNTGFAGNKIILWVRDINQPASASAPGHTLIVIYTSTGLIAAHPVDFTSADRYSFTRDGRSSGL
jgi:prepilin-type N-terminal cleavage/methylation domain-containing protein